MTTRTRSLAALAGVALLAPALAGCTSSEPAAEDPAPSDSTSALTLPATASDEPVEAAATSPLPAGEDYWFGTMDGNIGKFTFPGDPVAEYEELRSLVDGTPVTYVTVAVDNREAIDGANMYGIDAFDEDGRKYEFRKIDEALTEWQALVDAEASDYSNEDVELYNLFNDAINESTWHADVGEVAEFVLASADTELPAEFTRISVFHSGMFDPVDARPISESEGINLDFEVPTN